jgi:hypothetical protein
VPFSPPSARLAGHGRVPAALAREIAADPTGTWQRLVTDDTGRLLDCGRTRYRPPARLREFIVAATANASSPAAIVAANTARSIISSPGNTVATDEHNLVCLCPRHHHPKHDTTWTIERLTDDTLRWTSPSGRIHLNEPATYPIDRTPDSVIPNDTNNDDEADRPRRRRSPETPDATR